MEKEPIQPSPEGQADHRAPCPGYAPSKSRHGPTRALWGKHLPETPNLEVAETLAFFLKNRTAALWVPPVTAGSLGRRAWIFPFLPYCLLLEGENVSPGLLRWLAYMWLPNMVWAFCLFCQFLILIIIIFNYYHNCLIFKLWYSNP